MHEGNAVQRAIERALAGQPVPPAPRLVIEVVDPTRAARDAVLFYAPPVLAHLGLPDAPFEVTVRAVTCASCGAECRPEPHDPVCDRCGALLPVGMGPAIACRLLGGEPAAVEAAGRAPAGAADAAGFEAPP